MSNWTHIICDDCWIKKFPDREPVRLKTVEALICCFCGNPTISSIYVRHDPKELKCDERHD